MQDLVEGDLIHTTDFRNVYSSVLDRWFSVDSEGILGAKYEPVRGFLA